jgi:hypothetical protein
MLSEQLMRRTTCIYINMYKFCIRQYSNIYELNIALSQIHDKRLKKMCMSEDSDGVDLPACAVIARHPKRIAAHMAMAMAVP